MASNKKIKLELTHLEMMSLINVIDSISAIIGCNGEEQDKEWRNDVKRLDKGLNRNGIKRINS